MTANDIFVLARALHVLGVVVWIGGVAFVTTVLIPALRRMPDADKRMELFEKLEGRFSLQAKFVTLITGASGFYMVYAMGAWDRFTKPQFWWMHAMVCVWAIFLVMLFIIEPLFLHRRMAQSPTPGRDFRRMITMHRVLLSFSLITVLGAAAGSHGFY